MCVCVYVSETQRNSFFQRIVEREKKKDLRLEFHTDRIIYSCQKTAVSKIKPQFLVSSYLSTLISTQYFPLLHFSKTESHVSQAELVIYIELQTFKLSNNLIFQTRRNRYSIHSRCFSRCVSKSHQRHLKLPTLQMPPLGIVSSNSRYSHRQSIPIFRPM